MSKKSKSCGVFEPGTGRGLGTDGASLPISASASARPSPTSSCQRTTPAKKLPSRVAGRAALGDDPTRAERSLLWVLSAKYRKGSPNEMHRATVPPASCLAPKRPSLRRNDAAMSPLVGMLTRSSWSAAGRRRMGRTAWCSRSMSRRARCGRRVRSAASYVNGDASRASAAGSVSGGRKTASPGPGGEGRSASHARGAKSPAAIAVKEARDVRALIAGTTERRRSSAHAPEHRTREHMASAFHRGRTQEHVRALKISSLTPLSQHHGVTRVACPPTRSGKQSSRTCCHCANRERITTCGC
ncbi:hypothetical protein DFJ74DRAFT_438417 [Hyaloraphidium curvatum]|nr:hypothetical protein DFJ74DRAFT_438417 [Hyaloraphidium curvatum]